MVALYFEFSKTIDSNWLILWMFTFGNLLLDAETFRLNGEGGNRLKLGAILNQLMR
jgi:hypothetical protein